MAEVEFSQGMGGYGDDAAGRFSLITMTNIAGAVVSLALIAGIGVWGYKLVMRDVTGIPVVRAAEGEMRVLPDDPGGQLAQHQGLAVNEIAAHGTAAGPVDQVTLAPPAVALDAEDTPVMPQVVATDRKTPAEFIASAEHSAADTAATSEEAVIDALVAELVGEAGTDAPKVDIDGPKVVSARVATGVAPQDTELAAAESVIETDATPDPVLAGLQQSVRPRLRPASGALLVQPVAYTPPAESAEIDAASIPSGTRLAQLGAFESPDIARAEWARMQQRFGAMLEDKSRVIEEAQSGGRTFYRLRAMGFVDLSDTRRFCSAIKAEGVDCIPVQVR